MPRKGPAPRRELHARPDLPVGARHPARQQGPAAGQALASPSASSTTPSTSSRTRPAPSRSPPQAGRRQRQAPARGQEPPRRRRHLPGARRGPAPPGQHPRHPLARRLRPPAPRATMAERLANELLDASNGIGAVGEAPGRPAQDGRVQQGLRPLPLVDAVASATLIAVEGTAGSDRHVAPPLNACRGDPPADTRPGPGPGRRALAPRRQATTA